MAVTTPPSVTALPTPPTRSDPANFASRGDAWNAAIPTFSTQIQAVATNVAANATDAATTSAAGAVSAAAALVSQAAAAASAQASAASAGAALWVSGTTYAVGVAVLSPVTTYVYRRRTAGAGTTDPSADPTNWALASSARLAVVLVAGTTVTTAAGGQYITTNAAATTLTLPATAEVGDTVGFIVGNLRTDNSIGRNGHLIMGRAEDMTIGGQYSEFALCYGGVSLGWRMVGIASVGASVQQGVGALTTAQSAAVAAAAAGSGVPGMRYKPTATASLFAFGDSITAGQGMTVPADTRYSKLIATARGLTETNLAQSGTAAGRWVNDRIASRVFSAGDQVLILPGFNDARWGGSTANNLAQYGTNLMATLAWLGVSDASKVYSQTNSTTPNPAMTFSDTWVNSTTWIGDQAQSRCGAYSSFAAQYCEATVIGDTVHIMLGGYAGVGAACEVSIDGVAMGAGTITPKPLIAIPDGGTEPWQPYCIRIPGLSSGSHVVRVTLTASANLLVGYIAGYDSSVNTRPMIYVGSTLRMTAAGYAVSPANSSNAIMKAYQDETRRIVDTLAAEGLLVRYVDVDSAWTPSAGGINADAVHPLEIAHKAWAQKFLSEIGRAVI